MILGSLNIGKGDVLLATAVEEELAGDCGLLRCPVDLINDFCCVVDGLLDAIVFPL